MEKIAIYLFLFVIFILMTIKNIGLIRRNAQAKKCNDFCQALLDEKENSYENLVNYINNQKENQILQNINKIKKIRCLQIKQKYSCFIMTLNHQNLKMMYQILI